MRILVDVMEDPFAEDKDKIKAADSVLDRGHGKASQALIVLPHVQQFREAAAKLTRADLERIIREAPLPQLRHESELIEAEFEEVDQLLK